MNKFKKAFTDKKFKYGAFSTLTAIFVIAIIVVVNLVASQFDLKYDLTSDKRYSLSEETKEIIKDLDEDINIYPLFLEGSQDPRFTELIDQYEVINKNIKVSYKDPTKYPTFVAAYQKDDEAIGNNSVIVESGEKYKVIPYNDLVTVSYPYQEQMDFTPVVTAINIEPEITNAIQYVLQEKTSTIYSLSGHNEVSLPNHYIKALNDMGFDYSTIDISLKEGFPEDCEMLVMTTPESDISKEEQEKILGFLKNNGKAIIIMDSTVSKMPNLMGVLGYYGVTIEPYTIFEGATEFAYPTNNTIFQAQIYSHEFTDSLISAGNANPIVAMSTGIGKTEMKRDTVTIDPILTTSNKAYAKDNVDSESMNKEEGDLEGTFNIGVLVTDKYYVGDTDYETQLAVFSTTSIISESIDAQLAAGRNSNFILKTAGYMADKEETTYIPAKSLKNTSYTTVTASQANVILITCVIALPAVILVTGLAVWLRRRNK